jgi:hypothetical protein
MPVISVPIERYHKKFLQKQFEIEVIPLNDSRFDIFKCIVSKPRIKGNPDQDLKLKAPDHINIFISDGMVMRMKYFSYYQNKRDFNARVDIVFRHCFMLHMSEVLLYSTPQAENKLHEFLDKFEISPKDGITFQALYKYYQRHRGKFNLDKNQNWGWKTHQK